MKQSIQKYCKIIPIRKTVSIQGLDRLQEAKECSGQVCPLSIPESLTNLTLNLCPKKLV